MDRTTTTHEKTEPERTCVGCRQRRPQSALVRCALTADGRLVLSRSAPGRGAWLCRPPADCLPAAIRRRGFERVWRRSFERAVLEELAGQLAAIDGVAAPEVAGRVEKG